MSRARYYPVSQSFLNDPETLEMRDCFGDRSVFMWMSILSAGELNDGQINGNPEYIARIHGQYLDRTHPERAQKALVYLVNRAWLTPTYKDGLIVGYFITNYWKYHKRRDPVRLAPSEPSYPNPPNHQKKIKSIAPHQNFPEEWKWLESWVRKQNSGFPIDRFLDWPWWDAVSETCGGLSEDWLESQSAAWRRWIMDNPTRSPTPRGYRKFVAGWLERSYDKERRYGKTKI